MPILIILAVLGALALLGAYICYRIVFYAPPAKPLAEGEFDLPPDDIYKPHWPQMAAWQTQIRSLPRQEWTVFPLSDGSGEYEIGVYENITGTKYATVLKLTCTVTLTDEFAPFLRPNQFVNFSQDSRVVSLGTELTAGRTDTLSRVEAIYDYVVATLEYDYEKAASVKSGYLPNLDQVLDDGKGICFDYAALMTAMLRSQQIPCKLVVGYAGSTSHAWISVWTGESGLVDGVIFFDGQQWKRMDPTFASTGNRSDEILSFIQNGTYQAKYLY